MADSPPLIPASVAQWPPPSPRASPTLLTLSDELLLIIVQHLDRHTDVPFARLTCRKINALADTYFFRNIMITLPEEISEDKWALKLRVMPSQITKAKQFTVLNQRKNSSGQFYESTICEPHSVRLQRWASVETQALKAHNQFSKAACLIGVQYYPKLSKFAKRQLTAFRQAHSLEELEITMILPPSAEVLRNFQHALKHKALQKLRSFKYHGLSHTEPLEINRPAKGGRFRMLRPLFQKFHTTIEELVLSQDHCISQVGKTPMTLGRNYLNTLSRLDDLYIHHATNPKSNELPPVTLKLMKLELGGFHVDNLFDVPSTDTAPPRVRLHLPSIRRLVLNNVFGLDGLLPKLTARKGEIHITELGLRLGDQDDSANGDDLESVYESLRDFLLSFKGLEILSVLIDGDAEGIRIGKDILIQHSATLQAYSVAARSENMDYDESHALSFASSPTYGIENKDEINPGYLDQPPTLREYGTFLNKTIGTEYPRLRYLSQFPYLRTVVVRNFPAFGRNGTQICWRNEAGAVTYEAIKGAESFAEGIALPFHTLPDSYAVLEEPEANDDFNVAEENERIKEELRQITSKHDAKQDGILGVCVKEVAASLGPDGDLTRQVLKQKAKIDQKFRDAMSKVKKGAASVSERVTFDDYKALVRATLGIRAPLDETKPKLRLLIIGDWTYRDQMNITGPRKWDPTAWVDPTYSEDAEDSDENVSEIEDEDDYMEFRQTRGLQYRQGSKLEFAEGLLPIFFSIDWVKTVNNATKKHQWSARATVLEQDSTLEGQGALADTKLLDFAWMI